MFLVFSRKRGGRLDLGAAAARSTQQVHFMCHLVLPLAVVSIVDPFLFIGRDRQESVAL